MRLRFANPIVLDLLLLAALTDAASAQTPAGPEFRVNTYTTGSQFLPWNAVSVAPNGSFVVAWSSSGQDGSDYGNFSQLFDAAGTALGPEFRVNAYTTGQQSWVSVAADGHANVIAVWQSVGQDGSLTGVFGRRFDPTGRPRGAEFRVNTVTAAEQDFASVAADRSGGFVVVWTSNGPDGSGDGIFSQRYDSGGSMIGTEFRVNSFTPGAQFGPALDMDAAGNFVVVWRSYGQDGSNYGVFGRRFTASGAPIGADFQVNTTAAGIQYNPDVAVDRAGNFLVVWDGAGVGDAQGVFARRYDAAGAAQAAEFRVNSFISSFQYHPSVDTNERGDFLVTWASDGQDGSGQGIFGRRVDSTGTLQGTEFQINTFTPSSQWFPAVATDVVGNAVTAWRSFAQDGSAGGIFGQRLGGLIPVELSVDSVAGPNSDGNRVFEAGETVAVAPSWRNVNGLPQTFSSTNSAFTGPGAPGDPVYTISDGSANYGSVPNGSVGSCAGSGDCCVFASTVPTTRPARHWDATFREDIAPAAQGQSKLWKFHVGDTFADVPRSSPFYRFIEALAHHDVTTGCNSSDYCPLNGTTREQLAVFVLFSKEGFGYTPPACAAPMFADVPASSSFCRWIEELARRGVVSGCGGGNYCPSAQITREQMAVFVLATKEPGFVPPACSTPMFSDVPPSSPYCRWIEELARRGVVSGCGGGAYCPTGFVPREQMAVFITVTFGLLLYGP